MSETKFTPGPWHANQGMTGLSIRGPKNETVFARDYTTPHNAFLITAAPELYAALEGMLAEFNEQMAGIVHDEQAAICTARAALAKARGES